MKTTIITALLALVWVTGQAKVFKTMKEPEVMACANMRDGELRVREVTLADTATTVRFTMDYPKGQWFRFVAGSYLIGEDGKRYPMRSAEGIRLQELFRFNGIPHYETITPDGRVVRDDLRINGFYNLDYELKRLLEKLK